MRNNQRIWLTAAAAALIFLFVWEQVSATRIGYKMSSAREDLRDRRERVAALRLELESLLSPGALASEASRRLGMTPTVPESVVILSSRVPRTPERGPNKIQEPRYLTRLIQ